MISIIVCSKYQSLDAAYCENIKNTIGVPYELVGIDNSKGKYSLTQAYNEGVRQAKYPYLLFVHEDVVFQTQDWGQNLINHLKRDEVGIVGLAGCQAASRVPEGSWQGLSLGGHLLQGTNDRSKKPKMMHGPKNFNGTERPAVLLDGVFLGMRRNLLDTISFDNNLNRFHGYDVDICMAATDAGKTNYVIYDILLTHYSLGVPNKTFHEAMFYVYDKWADKLPMIAKGAKITNRDVRKWEMHRVKHTPKYLIRTGYTDEQVLAVMNKYANRAGQPLSKIYLLWLKVRFKFIRHNSKRRHKFID